ncbi:SRPBCC family protein [Rhodococcus globerulus]|uniref:SRPBCC family protein n=1 Tax=Rhodococcus globerulus TaxID=33008 RepID=UPI000AFDF310|nr:SRPBCC domain-containing protein [Rhodococcus globerulus]
MSEHNVDQTAEFTIIRIFDAPRELLWRAWTDPDEAARWWHPRGVRSPREHVAIDPRVGGTYSYLMINDEDGAEYPTGGTYLEVEEPKRLVFTWGNPEESVESAPRITVTLVEQGDKTEMTFHLVGIPGFKGDGNVYDGWSEAFDLFEESMTE